MNGFERLSYFALSPAVVSFLPGFGLFFRLGTFLGYFRSVYLKH